MIPRRRRSKNKTGIIRPCIGRLIEHDIPQRSIEILKEDMSVPVGTCDTSKGCGVQDAMG